MRRNLRTSWGWWAGCPLSEAHEKAAEDCRSPKPSDFARQRLELRQSSAAFAQTDRPHALTFRLNAYTFSVCNKPLLTLSRSGVLRRNCSVSIRMFNTG